jgi:hypothetical protein
MLKCRIFCTLLHITSNSKKPRPLFRGKLARRRLPTWHALGTPKFTRIYRGCWTTFHYPVAVYVNAGNKLLKVAWWPARQIWAGVGHLGGVRDAARVLRVWKMLNLWRVMRKETSVAPAPEVR